MSNMEASTVAKLLVEQLFSRFGVPDQLHSDQARQFESKLFAEMCNLLQIDKTRTTPYHPQSDGMVERFNKTLCSMLRAYINWDLLLPYVTMAYRATEHESTRTSPNMIMLGHNTRTPLDLIYQMPPNVKPVPANEWVWVLQDRLESVNAYVRENTGMAILRQKKTHDKRVSMENFNTDGSVYVLFPAKKPGETVKFKQFWIGPFQVVEQLSDLLLNINCGRNGTLQVIHINRVRKARKQTLIGESEGRGMPESVDQESDRYDSPIERRKPRWMRDYISEF